MMTQSLTTLLRRDDTFLGVCQAIGDDFGFNPDWLRVGLALPVIFNPLLSLGIYAALAVTVVLSRLVSPVKTVRVAKAEPVAVLPRATEAANDELVLAKAA